MNRVRANPRLLAVAVAISSMSLLIVLLSLSFLVLANVTIISITTTDQSASFLRLTAAITMFAVVTVGFLLGVMIAGGVENYIRKQELSPFFLPILAVKLCLFCLFSVVGISSLDRVMHGQSLHWTWVLDPDVRLFTEGLYLLLVLSLAWLLAVWLRQQGMRWRNIGGILLAAVAATGVVMILAISHAA